MNEKRVAEIRSSWILPSGTIQIVTDERHDSELPKVYTTVESAEKACVRVSCGWGYDAPISTIYIPKRPTINQAKVLYEMDKYENVKKRAVFLFSDLHSWNELIDLLI